VLETKREIKVLQDVMVEMRDGVRLAADIYFPVAWEERRDDNSWPVLLERTPYNKLGLNRSEKSKANPQPKPRPEIAREFAANGYVVVMQDCRGRYHSEGTFSKYLNEAEDGFDTMAWVVEQPWCNGKIGTFGVSYGAHTQIAAACLKPPGLASMFLDSGGFASAYHGGIRRGGAFEMKQVTWAHRHALLSPETETDPARKRALEDVNLNDWFHKMPWTPGNSPLSAAPEYEAYLFEQWQNGEYTDYWKRLGISAIDHYHQIPDVPVMILNSWYDPYVGTSITNFLGLKKSKRSPVFLTMGPWTHGQRSISFSGDVDFGEDAVFETHFGKSYIDYRIEWFDWCLKGKTSGQFQQDEPVNLFVMGGGAGSANLDDRLIHGGEWKKFSSWPIPQANNEPLYFRQNGELSRNRPASHEAMQTILYDPLMPTPSIGGSVTSGEPLMEGGAFDQREQDRFFGCYHPGRDLKERPDTLSFETQPLSADVTVSGPVTATLWVASDCVDTDFVVKLIDVHPASEAFPDGFAMNITDGILRARYRNGGEKSELMRPGEVYKIEVELFASANTFKKGHRIRVDIASCNYPQFDFNPNTGEPEGAWTTTIRARNKVFMDINRPSHITLPILSAEDAS